MAPLGEKPHQLPKRLLPIPCLQGPLQPLLASRVHPLPLQLVGPEQGGKPLGEAARVPLLPLLRLQILPAGLHLLRGLGLGPGEDVGVAADELFHDGGLHVLVGEASLLLGDDAVEGHLQEDVPKLLGHLLGVPLQEGVRRLAGLLQEVGHQALVGLGPVPGAPPRGPQAAHHLKKPLHAPHSPLEEAPPPGKAPRGGGKGGPGGRAPGPTPRAPGRGGPWCG